MLRNHLNRLHRFPRTAAALMLGAVALICGCGGEGEANTFEVVTVPSVATLALRYNQPFPEGVDTLRVSGFTVEEGEDHAHRESIQAQEDHEHEDGEEELILIFGPETRSAVTDIDLTDVPTNVIHVEIEYLAGEERVGHSEVDVELTNGATVVIRNPEIELEEEHEDGR